MLLRLLIPLNRFAPPQFMPDRTEFAFTKHALVLEKDSASCNSTLALLGSLGYVVTPVFRPKKALLAVRIMPFDLIFIHFTAIPYDCRSLTRKLKRCSPLSFIVLVIEPSDQACERGALDSGSVDAMLQRPLMAHALQGAADQKPLGGYTSASQPLHLRERRQWSTI